METLRGIQVAVTGGLAQDAHTGLFLGKAKGMCLGRLLRLTLEDEEGRRTITFEKKTVPAHPFHGAIKAVIEILAGDPKLEGRYLNAELLFYRKASPLEFLAGQVET